MRWLYLHVSNCVMTWYGINVLCMLIEYNCTLYWCMAFYSTSTVSCCLWIECKFLPRFVLSSYNLHVQKKLYICVSFWFIVIRILHRDMWSIFVFIMLEATAADRFLAWIFRSAESMQTPCRHSCVLYCI